MANNPVADKDKDKDEHEDEDEDGRARREYRAWVRTHHPDAGGDPDSFAAELPAWQQRLAGRPSEGRPMAAAVTVFRTRHGFWVLERWWRRRHRPVPRVR